MRDRILYFFSSTRSFIHTLLAVSCLLGAGVAMAEAQSANGYTLVCADGKAGAYEAFPDVCRLNDGRLMCVFYAGYKHVSLPNAEHPKGGRLACCYSSDEGRTWTSAQTLFDGPNDDRDPSISQLKSGRLLCSFFILKLPEEEGKEFTGLGSWMVYSDDAGKTWSQPQLISSTYYCSSPIRELSDGRLALGLYAYANEGSEAWGAVAFSSDQGKSWQKPMDIDNAGMHLGAETDLIELQGGVLYAMQRSSKELMAWSMSMDGGATWTVSKPMDFPGHCPYLHRTPDGILLLAHRRPQTSLHYSLDDGRTWSKNVMVDIVHGAYPSMVTLKDGSTLIVYYEEGEGSNIRARRFLATRKGIQWLDISAGVLPEATVVSYRRIWDAAPHNAFTNLIRYKNQFFCVFREGEKHVSDDGALRVLRSKDGIRWESAARITSDHADLRDAQIVCTPDNRLMLTGGALLNHLEPRTFATYAYFSSDGEHWSEPEEIGDRNLWLWRTTWNKDTAYGIGYSTAGEWNERFLRLYKSNDGVHFDTLIDRFRENEYANESSLRFLEDDTCLCLLRRDNPKGQDSNGLLGIAHPPYTDWEWKDLGMRIGGPHFIRIPDGRFIAAVRLLDEPRRTSLCWLDPEAGTLREFLALPSGGDTSYPGLEWYDGKLWVSYYSSHEEKTCIYLAEVKIPEKNE